MVNHHNAIPCGDSEDGDKANQGTKRNHAAAEKRTGDAADHCEWQR
jgi:hypothetical protein